MLLCRHEKPGKTGIAHLFEHLMFNETEHLAAGAFDRELEELGAEATVGDQGIVHELVHLLHSGTETPLDAVRAQFAQVLRLA